MLASSGVKVVASSGIGMSDFYTLEMQEQSCKEVNYMVFGKKAL